MACSICRSRQHTARLCVLRPGATKTVCVSGEASEVVMETLRPIIRACAGDRNIVESGALSAYMQGVMDGRQTMAWDLDAVAEP